MATPEQPRNEEGGPIRVLEQEGSIYLIDESLGYLREKEGQVHEALERLTMKHTSASGGLLGLLPFNPEKYPAQRLDVVEVRAQKPAGIEILEAFATEAYPQFPRIKAEFTKKTHVNLFAGIIEDFKEGRDYIFAFDHGRIHNTPLGQVGVMGALMGTADRINEEMPPFDSRLTISKLISRISALGSSAVELLALGGVLDMSIPPSKTIEGAGIGANERRAFNTSLKVIRATLKEQGKTVVDFMSPSGTADVRMPARLRHLPATHMGPISGGTADMLCNARYVGISLNVDNPRPRIAIGRMRNPAPDRLEAHRVMFEIQQLAKKATGRNHVYHMTAESFAAATKAE